MYIASSGSSRVMFSASARSLNDFAEEASAYRVLRSLISISKAKISASKFLDPPPNSGGASADHQIYAGNYSNADQHQQENADPLELNAPGGLFIGL